MEKLSAGDAYDLLTVIFVDLSAGTTTLHFIGSLAEDIAADIGVKAQNGDFVFETIMSRKKDVIPLITNIIEKQKS